MQILPFLFRFLLFFSSLIGAMAFLHARTKGEAAFLPLIVTSSIAVLLFFAGLIGVLLPAVYALITIGSGALLFYVILAAKKRFSFAFLLSPGIIFFIAVTLFFIPVLWDAHYYHYDNFSHWGTVLSEMLSFDAFPNRDTVVIFRDYAPGTASFLYAFCRVVGTEESVALIGQSLLNASALAALFYRVKTCRSLRFLFTTLLAVVLLALLCFDDGTLHIYNLLVDATMGFVAVGSLFLRERFRDEPAKGIAYQIPVLTFLGVLKLNGLFFVSITLILILWDLFRARKTLRKRSWLFFVFAAVIPFAVRLFWRWYYLSAYPAENAAERRESVYAAIFSRLPAKLTDWSQVYLPVTVFLTLAVLAAWVILRKNRARVVPFLRRAALAWAILLLYLAATVYMYCFIMAPDEAIRLAAFERYIITPVIIFTALIAEAFFELVPSKYLASLALCVTLLCGVAPHLPQLAVRVPFETTERGRVYDCLCDAARSIPRNARVILYNGATGRRDLYYRLMLYQLKSRACFVLDTADPSVSFTSDLGAFYGSDYLILGVTDAVLPAAMDAAGMTAKWKDGCRVYRITRDAQDRVLVLPIDSAP